MNYETFRAEYQAAFAKFLKYGPDKIGGAEAVERMTELAEAFPEFAERAENETA
jgi:hypothetical protein